VLTHGDNENMERERYRFAFRLGARAKPGTFVMTE
jgi:hypothetical protein